MTTTTSTVHQLETELPGLESDQPFQLMNCFGPIKTTFGLGSDERGLSTQEIFRKRLGEYAVEQNLPHTPSVQIVDREPSIVLHKTKPTMPFTHQNNESLLANSFMSHIPNTSNLYKCKDCSFVLKTGNDTTDLHTHIWKGDGQCRYIKAMFRGRENHLVALRGQVRCSIGRVALPKCLTYANEGFMTVAGRELCVVCCSTKDEPHHDSCERLASQTVENCKTLALGEVNREGPLVRVPRMGEHKPSKESSIWTQNNFRLDYANGNFVQGTVDTFNFPCCGQSVQDLVENDTPLGEHIYHVYNTGRMCPYIETRFNGKKDNLRLILGYERYRRGTVAFPDAIAKNSYGFVKINGRYRCVVCGVTGQYGSHYTGDQEHRSNCHYIKEYMTIKLL